MDPAKITTESAIYWNLVRLEDHLNALNTLGSKYPEDFYTFLNKTYSEVAQLKLKYMPPDKK